MRAFLASFLLPALVAAAAALLMFHFLERNRLLERSDDEMAWIRQAARHIAERYCEPVSAEELAYDAIRGMAKRDLYSDFIDPDEEARFREENEGRYVGIGFAVYPAGEPVTVLYAFPGSPAEKAGLKTGDRIIGVDGVDCTALDSDAIVGRIKIMDGAGVPVRVTVRPYVAPGEAPLPDYEVEVARDTIQRPSVIDPRIVDAERGIAYVRLKAFQEESTGELRQALGALATAGMKSLVLDLRGNRGGLLEEAVGISSLFIDEGVVVATKGRARGTTQVYRAADEVAPFRGLPLVLLVDGGSASASEILAGALQDHQRALLVGDRTFGKGMVQSVIMCDYQVDGKTRTGRLKITTSRYYTPAGRAIEKVARGEDGEFRPDPGNGLPPDILLPIEDDLEQHWLEAYIEAREIPDETWRVIEERCPQQRHVREEAAGRLDRQLEAALEILAGGKGFNTLS
ncbi:MAG: S41 family peptidase [Planctomycetes bacterium]|nr:S41 family peptidase [Planctomycetota bacterium]